MRSATSSGFLLIVGHKDAGDVNVIVQAPKPRAQLLTHLGVERAEGFVEQEHFGLHGQGARQSHALPLSSGKLRREAVGERLQLDKLQKLVHLGADHFAGGPLALGFHGEAEGHVIENGHVAKQRVMLKHKTHAALPRVAFRAFLFIENHRAAVRVLKAGDDPQQRRLAGTGRAQKGDEFAIGNEQADVFQRFKAAKSLRDVPNLDAHGC